MTAVFRRASASVQLSGDFFPFHYGYLRAPAVFRRPALREYIHEVLHFWQLLGSGFLANLTAQEWGLVLESENGRGRSGVVPELSEEFHRVHATFGFSAWNLHEALCRFWDVQIVGPHNLLDPTWSQKPFVPTSDEDLRSAIQEIDAKTATGEQFDAVVSKLMLERDIYAGPYHHVLELLGSLKAAVYFPLIGYFAMQSVQPTSVFAAAVATLRDVDTTTQPTRRIEQAWRTNYEDTRAVCAIASHSLTGHALTPGWTVILGEPLASHPVFSWYAGRLARPNFRNHFSHIDLWLATPGDSEHRDHLINRFRPAVTLFHDGWWSGALPNNSTELRSEFEALAATAKVIDGRLRDADLVRKYGLASTSKEGIAPPAPAAIWTELEAALVEDFQAILEAALREERWRDAARVWQARFGGSVPTQKAMQSIFTLALKTQDAPYDDDVRSALQDAAQGDDPHVSPWAAQELGAILEELGDKEGALSAYRRAVNWEHPYYSAKAALALGHLLELDSPAVACQVYSRAMTYRHEDITPKTAFNLGLQLTRLERYTEAEEAYRRALEFEHWDVDPKAAYNLGLLRRDAGDLKGASEALTRALDGHHPEISLHARHVLDEVTSATGVIAGHVSDAPVDRIE